MVRVTILAGEADQMIGEFEFEQLPREGEEICVPGDQSKDGYVIRFFTVREVSHVASGVTSTAFGAGPRTVLRYCEEIL